MPQTDFIDLQVLSDELVLASTEAGPKGTTSLHARRLPLAAPEFQLQALDTVRLNGTSRAPGHFHQDLKDAGWPVLQPARLEIFQINLGKLCNMTCRHCHVDSGPDRVHENMSQETVEACIRAIDISGAHTIDLTGGAPELNPNFEYLVNTCVEHGKHVIDRCNLTILMVPRYKHLPAWLAERNVEIVCSLPHYRKRNTDIQRGKGTYEKSIKAIRRLNEAGYGQGDPNRILTLVTNPVGAFLSGDQGTMEAEWKAALARNHGISFDRLIAINNMPISRYLEWLLESGNLEAYMERLVNAFNPATIAGLMCRNTLSVSWDGRLFDCDFNQMLEIEARLPDGSVPHVADFNLDMLAQRTIQTARHCYGCTAGSGSSCGGAIA